MEQDRQDILNKKEAEKMCLSGKIELEKMCSAKEHGACGDRCLVG